MLSCLRGWSREPASCRQHWESAEQRPGRGDDAVLRLQALKLIAQHADRETRQLISSYPGMAARLLDVIEGVGSSDQRKEDKASGRGYRQRRQREGV